MPNALSYAVIPGGLTPAHHDQIFELAERGWKATRIARKLRKHPGTVQWFMYRHGLKAPVSPSEPRAYTRNGRTVKLFMPEEDAFIESLRAAGKGPTEIARLATERFGHPRNMHTIACRLVMLAAREVA